ncbi:hypothetical protein GCM10023189_07570 [Nibrella saemangeumensis]|uniref:DUF4230 domain-containing protein n=1 Tax=Nibrella saemangeumensis TaxID=1084526 RepID=A0ABP8MGZ4_9BACT
MIRFTNTIVRVFLVVLLVIGLISLWEQVRHRDWFSRFRKEEKTLHSVVLKEVTALGKLELVKYTFKDIVEHEQVKDWLPDAQAVLIIEGEAVGCVDLTQVKATDIEPEGDSLVVWLPQPELCTWRINHERSRVYTTRFAFLDESQLVNAAYQRAERQIRQSALNSGILAQTQQNAEKMLRPLLEQVAGKKVVIRYQPPDGPARTLQ